MSASRRIAVAALAAALSVSCHPADAGDGAETTWSGSEPAPELDGMGVRADRPLRLADERGKVLVLSFGYTSCLEVCPDTFSKAKALFAALGDAARRVAFVYVTVDPERDTPAVLRTFLDSVDPRFEGLYVQGDRLAPLLAAYHVTVRKRLPDPQAYARRNVDPSTYYTMDHTSGFWLIDQDANLRMRLAHDAPASALVAGVERLLDTGIHVDAAEVRVLPSHAGAFYARIANDSGDADRLTSVDSPEVEDAQLHEVFNAGGVTSMREAPGGFPLPAHSALVLQRGGRHVMLFGAHPGGDRLPLTLHFEHGRSLLVDAAVRSALDSN